MFMSALHIALEAAITGNFRNVRLPHLIETPWN